MSESHSSPFKKVANFFRRNNTDGGNDDEAPPPVPEGGAGATASTEADTSGDKKRKRDDDGDDGDNDRLAPAERSSPMQSKLAQVRSKLKTRESQGISTHLNPLPVNTAEQDPRADLPELPTSPGNISMYMGNISANINPDQIYILQPTPEKAQIDKYRTTGAQYEAWMANTNPAGPACPVTQSTLTIAALVEANPPDEPLFSVWESSFVVPPIEIRESLKSTDLPKNPRLKKYRHSSLQRNARNEQVHHVSSYDHCIVKGAIIATSIFRMEWGPRWSDVALALYKQDAAIGTLRYVFMVEVENDETLPLVGKVLYRNNDLPGPETRGTTPTIYAWDMNTPEFQQILGTQLGRAVACLVLGAWPMGTHRITRIHTWFLKRDLHMRFDIEPIVPAGALPAPAAEAA
ncbi:uncharacterized protein N7518_002882 [Penicillium psychrosexuale]|uniref:uncharacterized protein n=1 Tax=Penicillium psychrosexuale TaxID=1002107 RepID=UPI002544F998|nr:uncharacterized protein N7518_002882 [Penicillium psychrosexuale]KAJ5800814.1 hypothetical protein N7518_002882 [Penicillium psychrosexuale]